MITVREMINVLSRYDGDKVVVMGVDKDCEKVYRYFHVSPYSQGSNWKSEHGVIIFPELASHMDWGESMIDGSCGDCGQIRCECGWLSENGQFGVGA